ncbi:MAG: S9 family peptidase [bacterium]|nr:S9 family peptidase [bacterium]
MYHKIIFLLFSLVLVFTFSCARAPEPPVAAKNPVELEKFGDVRTDNYFWLRERENPEVISHLEAENEYTKAMMSHTDDLQESLYNEIVGRIKEDDTSVPYKMDDYYYYSRYEEGKDYPIYCRKKDSLEGTEEILLDVNVMAVGYEYYSVSSRAVSFNQDILAFTEDVHGRRINTLKFKNLKTGEYLPDEIPEVTSNVVWANDNKTIFYTKQDMGTLRWYQIYRHILGTSPDEDDLVFEETDDTFSCRIFRTKSKKYMMISSTQTLSAEYLYLDADNPSGLFRVIQTRERDHEYSVDHFGDYFYITSNWNAQNFRLMRTRVNRTQKRYWEEVIPHRSDVLFNGIEIFSDYLVVNERKEGLRQLRIMPWSGTGEHYLEFEEPAYAAYIGTNLDFDTPLLRFEYTSLTTPETIYDYNMQTKEKTMLKQQEVLGGYDPADYQTERIYADTRDGTKVPISLVYKKDLKKPDGTNPLWLYGYGSYGSSRDATFNSPRISMLDRGFIYAIAHIRGGSEMGRYWYEEGKLLNKKNTFTDFIDCGEYLIKEGYTGSEKLFASGGSAGGLLIGAVINMRPDLFEGVIASVPWVDVITTMLDETIPLTTSEYDEWGNPNDKEYYDYMLSYSPYDQVEAKGYPHMLVLTSLYDSQVQYFEPAKWVAKLREMKTDENLLLLETKMEGGHGGASGRYKRYRDNAFQFAFFLDLAGIDK